MDEDDDSEGWEETQYESLDWGDEESSSSLVALYCLKHIEPFLKVVYTEKTILYRNSNYIFF